MSGTQERHHRQQQEALNYWQRVIRQDEQRQRDSQPEVRQERREEQRRENVEAKQNRSLGL